MTDVIKLSLYLCMLLFWFWLMLYVSGRMALFIIRTISTWWSKRHD